MNQDKHGELEAAWRADTAPYAEGRECPDSALIYTAVAGHMDASDRRDLVLHIARCGACAESWRVALELQRARDDVVRPARFGRQSGLWAMAAAICLALGIWWMNPLFEVGVDRSSDPSVLRDVTTRSDFRLYSQGQIIPSQALRLEWEAVAEAIDYQVHLTDAELQTVFAARTPATFIDVPAGLLQDLRAGDRLLWYVIAHFEDGREQQSNTGGLMVADHDVKSQDDL